MSVQRCWLSRELMESVWDESKQWNSRWMGRALLVETSSQGFKRGVVDGAGWNTARQRHEIASPKPDYSLRIRRAMKEHLVAVNETKTVKKRTLPLHLDFLKYLWMAAATEAYLQLHFDGFAWNHHELRDRRRARRGHGTVLCGRRFTNTHCQFDSSPAYFLE